MNFFEMQNEILNVNRSDIFNKYLKLFRDHGLMSGLSSFLCKFLKKYFGEGNLPSLILKYSFELIC